MKRLIAILSFIILGSVAMAQSAPAVVATDGNFTSPKYVQLWGTSSDTLTNADTLTFVYRFNGDKVVDLVAKLYSDHVSGTAGGTLISYQSIDGVNYEATGDTITVSSLTGDAMDAEEIDLDNFIYPYLKFVMIQSGTAVTVPKVTIIARGN